MSGLILNVAVMGVGMHMGAWRHPEAGPFSYLDLDYYLAIARRAEAAHFHAIFLADTLIASEENYERPNFGAMDPVVVLAALAGATRHLGLIATATTTFSDPFSLARRFGTLDQLSRGRAGWNIVTTFLPAVAANFGTELPGSAERYARAEEFVDVVTALWESWPRDALVGDKARGLFADPDRIRPIDHDGPHFRVRGPLTLPQSPQGRPVLLQSGSSEEGRALGARVADAVFTVQTSLEGARAFYGDMKARAIAAGRRPEALKVLPGLLPIVGRTRAEALERKEALDGFIGDAQLRKLARRLGIDVGHLSLDAPLPVEEVRKNGDFRGSRGFRDAALQLAENEGLTVREILFRNGGGQFQVIGTPDEIADTMAAWHRGHAADGFNIMPDVLPDGFDRFVDEVVPRLRRKAIFRDAHEGATLRENLFPRQ